MDAQQAGKNQEMDYESRVYDTPWIKKYWSCLLAGLFLLLFLFGIYYAYSQPNWTATIIATGERTKSVRHRNGHSSSTAYYCQVTVSWTDEEGQSQTGSLKLQYSYWFPPKAGEKVHITRGLTGLTAYPDDTLRVLCWVGVLFSLLGIWITFMVARAKYRVVPTDASGKPLGEAAQLPVPELSPVPPDGNMQGRIRKSERGTYSWVGNVSAGEERKTYSRLMITFGIISAFILSLGAGFCSYSDDWGPMWIIVGVVVVFILICFLVCIITKKGSFTSTQYYELYPDRMEIGYGKNTSWLSYEKVTLMEIYPNCVQLTTNRPRAPIFLPEIDSQFVVEWLRARIPSSAPVYEYTDPIE